MAMSMPSTASRPAPFTFVGRLSSNRQIVRTRRLHVRMESGSSFPEGLINSISVAVTNFQPANTVKKGIAKLQAGSFDEAAVAAKVDSLIADNPVAVFSWTRCPFCVKAKKTLTDMGAKFIAVELDTMADGAAIRYELAKRTDRTSMPNIFIKGESIGGCNDGPGLLTLLRTGELEPRLKAAGAL